MKECCRRCCRKTSEAQLVDLWDGNKYCTRCIESVSSALLRFARENEELREELPFDLRNELRAQMMLFIKVVLMLGPLFSIPAYPTYGVKGVVLAMLGTAMLAGVAWAIQGPLLLLNAKSTRPAVTVRNGMVTARRPSQRRKAKYFTVPLRRCSWYEGKVKHDSFYRGLQARGQHGIILVYSICWGRWRLFNYRIACGFTPELLEIWKGFLQLIALPQYQARKRGHH